MLSETPLAALVLVCVTTLSAGARAADPPATYRPGSALDDGVLSQVIWAYAPALAAARAQVGVAHAGVRRAHLFPNPQLDVNWGTIPLGQTTPPTLPAGSSALTTIPNYNVGLSELIEIGKRGPRQRAAREALTATSYDAYAQLADAYFDVLTELGIVATAQLRAFNMQELVDDAAELTELQRQRVSKGDAPALDAERASLEETKLRTQRDEELARLAEALRSCSQIIGVVCQPFPSIDDAGVFLAQSIPLEGDLLAQRPDLKALDHQRLAALAARDLASNKAIPDPTVRFGYVYDQFVISGNQRNSLFVGVSIPITVADHGQADVLEADAIQAGASAAHDRLTNQAREVIAQLQTQRNTVAERRTRMRDQTLPQARGIVRDLGAVVSRGGASLQELLLARRTLGELLLDSGELDRLGYNIELALARTRGWAPRPPSALNDELTN